MEVCGNVTGWKGIMTNDCTHHDKRWSFWWEDGVGRNHDIGLGDGWRSALGTHMDLVFLWLLFDLWVFGNFEWNGWKRRKQMVGIFERWMPHLGTHTFFIFSLRWVGRCIFRNGFEVIGCCLGTHTILVFDFACEGMGLDGFFFEFLYLCPKAWGSLRFFALWV